MKPYSLAFSYFVLGISYVIMAVYLLWKNPRSRLNVTGSLLGVAIAGWALCSIGTVMSQEAPAAMLWAKLFLAFVVFVPFLNLLFIHRFLASISKLHLNKKLLISSAFLSALFLLSDATPYLITGVSLRPGNFYFKDPGPLYHLFELYFFFTIVYSSWGLLKGLQISSRGSREERQVLVLFLTLVISYIAGGMSYLLAHNKVHFSIVSIGNYLAIPYSLGIIVAIYCSPLRQRVS